MKKHFKFLTNSILATVAISSTAISCGLVLSSCTNTNNNNNNNENDNLASNDIKIEDQSADNHEVTSGTVLTLYVNVKSTKPVKYQWFVDKNNSNSWTKIANATESSYSITSDSTQNITSNTTWKYKVEIYDVDDANIKLTSNTYNVNIKPQSTTPNPSPNPNPGPNPEPNPTPPTNPDSNPSTSINSSSITLNNIGQLLPSQYLSNLNDLTLDKSLIKENFDTSKIKNVSYKVNELNDQDGTLTIVMNYIEDNTSKSQTFNFTKLLNLDSNSNSYHFEFENVAGILNLSAQEIAAKKINNKSDFKNFIQELEKSNIKFKFTYKGIKLPLDYLDLGSVNINGFGTKWFTTNSKLVLNFDFKNLKINYYVKNANSSNITNNSFEYPSHISKQATMEFYSATDFLLNQITNKSTYNTNKYAAYYYYDIIENDAVEAQIQISDSYWLSNVTNELTYENKNYTFRPILNKNSVSSENGSLTINLSMKYEGNDSTNITSQTTKDITITGFAKYDQNNLFSNSSDVNGRFSLSCEVENYDINIQRLKKYKKKLILDRINAMEDKETSITFTNNEIPEAIIKTLTSSLICKFSGLKLIAGANNNNNNYYHNELTAINNFYIDNRETLLRYNKIDDVFQLVISNFSINGVGINKENHATNANSMIVNITHPGDSLNKLTKA